MMFMYVHVLLIYENTTFFFIKIAWTKFNFLFFLLVPMNKIQVGHAPSPNLKAVRSKIGSLDNAGYKPGGGNVKIETKKIEIKAAPRIEAKNDKYIPKGGEKKVRETCKYWIKKKTNF